MSASAAAASMSQRRAMSARETMPTSLPWSTTGNRRTCDHAAAHYLANLQRLGVGPGGDAAEHDVAVSEYAAQAAAVVGDGQGAEVHALQKPRRGDDRLLLAYGHDPP